MHIILKPILVLNFCNYKSRKTNLNQSTFDKTMGKAIDMVKYLISTKNRIIIFCDLKKYNKNYKVFQVPTKLNTYK